jgi:Spy/CpxP family protein refolding chaperone
MKTLARMSLVTRTVAAAALAVGVFAASTQAQDQPANPPAREPGRPPGGDNGGPGGGPGGGQRFDPQQMRKMMMDRMKESLGSSDDEWKVIEPQLEKVFNLARQSSPGMGMWGGRGGRGRGPGSGPGGQGGGENAAAPAAGGPRGGDANPSEVAKAAQELSTVASDKSSSNDAIKAKIQALRAAREKARADLTAAQKELRELLSLRQEATLVSMGLLD